MTPRRPFASVGWFLLFSFIAVSGCRCDGDGVGSTTAGFRTDARELDFGKTLEGVEVTREVTLIGTGRVEVLVELTTEGPFRAPATVRVPGGGDTTFGVTFTAPEGEANGVLRLSARGETFEVALRGRGVRPLDCVASAPCLVSRFDLETEACVESLAAEGAGCTPANLCLENGQCRMGACVGTPRSCDDANACTRDACSPSTGCVNTDITNECPRPQNPCLGPICTPATGCGEGTLEDGTLCGPANCVSTNLCSNGTCTEVATPDGTICAPKTPCAGEARCSGGSCVRPDAGTMTPTWSVPLGDPPVEVARRPGRLRSLNGNVYFEACGLQSQDGGCALVSYTQNGFLRFQAPLSPDAGEAILQGVAGWGALVSDDESLSAYLPANGSLLWSLPLEALPFVPDGGSAVLPRAAVALEQDGRAWVAASYVEEQLSTNDAGLQTVTPLPRGVALLRLGPDGGVERAELLGDAGFGSALALSSSTSAGQDEVLWLHAPGAPLLRVTEPAPPLPPPDAGMGNGDAGTALDAGEWLVQELGAFDGGSLSAVARGAAAAVGGGTVAFEDGGVTLLVDPDAGETPVDYEVLFDGERAYSFFRACRAPDPLTCGPEEESTVLRVTDLSTLGEGWEETVLPGSVDGRLVEVALTGEFLPGGVLTLTEATPIDGARTDLQLFLPGGRALLCPLEGAPELEGALFAQGVLYALVSKNGQLRLEAYDLQGLPVLTTGWPRPNGAGTSRREDVLPAP